MFDDTWRYCADISKCTRCQHMKTEENKVVRLSDDAARACYNAFCEQGEYVVKWELLTAEQRETWHTIAKRLLDAISPEDGGDVAEGTENSDAEPVGYTYGEIAFKKYSEVRGGLALDGQALPNWEDMGQDFMHAWDEAAIAAIDWHGIDTR